MACLCGPRQSKACQGSAVYRGGDQSAPFRAEKKSTSATAISTLKGHVRPAWTPVHSTVLRLVVL
eukprot:10275364-Alexandrium_andersonii.AAC.1